MRALGAVPTMGSRWSSKKSMALSTSACTEPASSSSRSFPSCAGGGMHADNIVIVIILSSAVSVFLCAQPLVMSLMISTNAQPFTYQPMQSLLLINPCRAFHLSTHAEPFTYQSMQSLLLINPCRALHLSTHAQPFTCQPMQSLSLINQCRAFHLSRPLMQGLRSQHNPGASRRPVAQPIRC